MHEMSGIYEHHRALSFFGLSQSGFKLLYSKAFLLCLLVQICGPARDRTYFASLHPDALHEGSDLSRGAMNAGLLLYYSLCLCCSSRWMFFEVGLERGCVFV